jgi:hypothetical protein
VYAYYSICQRLYSKEAVLERLHSVLETASILGGLSRWTIYGWLSNGKVRGVKVGSRTMISSGEIERIVEEGAKKHADKKGQRSQSEASA